MSFKDRIHGLLGAALTAFGEPVVYLPSGGSEISITGIFDATTEEVDPNTGAIIISKKPMLGVRNADLPAEPKQGDRATINSITYKVVEVMSDGQGGSQLRLHKI